MVPAFSACTIAPHPWVPSRILEWLDGIMSAAIRKFPRWLPPFCPCRLREPTRGRDTLITSADHGYSEGTTGRTLTYGVPGSVIDGSAMTVALCVAACKQAGYALAGVEYASQCCKYPHAAPYPRRGIAMSSTNPTTCTLF